MKKTYIRTGSEIDTATGILKVTGYNGSIVYCEQYEPEMTETENGDYIDAGDMTKTDERRLTLEEIGQILKESDGQNNIVIWEE